MNRTPEQVAAANMRWLKRLMARVKAERKVSERAARLVALGYTIPFPDSPPPGDVVVIRNPDGSKCIHVNATDAARLAGRDEFGHVEEVQQRLLDAIADAWYGGGCPPEDGS